MIEAGNGTGRGTWKGALKKTIEKLLKRRAVENRRKMQLMITEVEMQRVGIWGHVPDERLERELYDCGNQPGTLLFDYGKLSKFTKFTKNEQLLKKGPKQKVLPPY